MSALFNIFDNEKNEYMTKKVRLSVKDYSCYDLNIKRLQLSREIVRREKKLFISVID